MKIYTKSGDKGETSLFDGKRVGKNHPIIYVCGALDEMSVELGALLTEGIEKKDVLIIISIQKLLYQIMGFVSGNKTIDKMIHLIPKTILSLEERIDEISIDLSPLSDFILPKGSELTIQAHRARVITRRAERELVSYLHKSSDDENMRLVVSLLNRASDYLFVIARSYSDTESIAKQ